MHQQVAEHAQGNVDKSFLFFTALADNLSEELLYMGIVDFFGGTLVGEGYDAGHHHIEGVNHVTLFRVVPVNLQGFVIVAVCYGRNVARRSLIHVGNGILQSGL